LLDCPELLKIQKNPNPVQSSDFSDFGHSRTISHLRMIARREGPLLGGIIICGAKISYPWLPFALGHALG
jgi:hypothetical protein